MDWQQQSSVDTALEVRCGLSNMDFHLPGPGYSHSWVSSLPAETNIEFLIWWHSLELSANYLGQVDYIGSLLWWKGQQFVLTIIDTYSGYRFAFLAWNASANTTVCGLTECLIHFHGISYYDQGTSLQIIYINGPELMEFTGLTMILPSWTIWHDRMVERPLEGSVTVPARWQYLIGLWQRSPGICTYSKAMFNIWFGFYHS